MVCVQHACTCVQCVGGRDFLRAGVGVGVLERKQSRSLQNLPGQGGWSWAGQAGAIPGFRGGIRGVHVPVPVLKRVCGFGGSSVSPSALDREKLRKSVEKGLAVASLAPLQLECKLRYPGREADPWALPGCAPCTGVWW